MQIKKDMVRKNILFFREKIYHEQNLTMFVIFFETILLSLSCAILLEIVFVFINFFNQQPIEFRLTRFMGTLFFGLVTQPIRLVILKRYWMNIKNDNE